MKVLRLKKIRKILQFYKMHHNLDEPYRVLVDADFIKTAIIKKLYFKEMLPKTLQARSLPMVTKCIVAEMRARGPTYSDVAIMAKRLEHAPCQHQDNPVTAAECASSVARGGGFLVATQDNQLQHQIQQMTGVPLIYWYNNILTLHEPSLFQQWQAKLLEQQKGEAAGEEKSSAQDAMKQIKQERKEQNYKKTVAIAFAAQKLKKKKAKGPNPLSVKKKKKKPTTQPDPNTVKKTRRKRKRRDQEPNTPDATDTQQPTVQAAVVDEDGAVQEGDPEERSAKRRKRYRPRVHKRQLWRKQKDEAAALNRPAMGPDSDAMDADSSVTAE